MAVNLGRERPTPPHVNPAAPAAGNNSPASRFNAAMARFGNAATRLDNQVAAETGRAPRAKQNYNHR